MRLAMLTTVAAAALSLSFAAVAQTGGTSSSGGAAGGASGGASTSSPSASGGASGNTSGGASGGATGSQQIRPQGGTTGGANTGPSASGSPTGTQQQGQSTANTNQPQQGQGTATSNQQRQQGQGPSGSATTTGSTNININLSGEQRTRAVQTLRSVNIQPVRENITVTVGQTLPTTVTQLHPCPETLLSLLTGVRECRVVLVNDRYYIVEPETRRVVTVIEREG